MIQCPCGIAKADCDYHKPEVPAPQVIWRLLDDNNNIPGGRASGRTTRQLQALPKGGWYFCSSDMHAFHTRVLAKRIGRTDIIVRNVSQLRDYYQFHGYQISGFDIDHAAQEQGLEAEILDGASKLRSCVKP